MYRITYALEGLRDQELALRELQILLDALTGADVLYLRAHPEIGPIRSLGLRYSNEPRGPKRVGEEDWQDIPSTLEKRMVDDRALAAWRAAELNVRSRVPARTRIVLRNTKTGPEYRVVVQLPDGRIEDPAEGRGWKPLSRPDGRQRIAFVLDLFNGPQERKLSHATLDILLEALTQIDQVYLEKHPETPPVYKSGIRYEEEPPGQEEWQDIPTTLRMGVGDCEDLSAWLAAEARVRRSIDARPTHTSQVRPDGSHLYHIRTTFPNGRIEDPSRVMGMR